MASSRPDPPQQQLDTGVFLEGPVRQETADIIRSTVSITRTIARILHRLGIIDTYPQSPIHIRQAGNQVEVKLTLAHGTVREIRESIEMAVKAAFAAVGLSLLAGGVIGYSCARQINSPEPSVSESQMQ